MQLKTLAALIAGVVCLSCTAKKDDAEPLLPPHFSLDYAAEPFEIQLRRDDQTIARIKAIQMGLVSDDNYNPNHFYDPHEDHWHPLEFQDIPANNLTLSPREEGTYTLTLAPTAPDGYRIANLRIVLEAPDGEQYYGLGEYFDSVTHRGRRRAMHFELDTTIESSYNEAHVAVPLLIGTGGWGIFVEDRRPGDFDVAKTRANETRITYEATELTFHLLAGDQPADVLARYVALTAQPSMPAQWAFGGHLWRNENESQAQFEGDLEAIRKHDLPLSVMWIDRPWQSNYNSFEMTSQKFPEPSDLVAKMHASGFRLAFWSSPYIHKDFAAMYDQFEAAKGFVGVPGGQWFDKFGKLVDLTNPKAIDLFSALINNAIELGAEGFKLDYAEDIQAGAVGTNLPFSFHNGQSEKTMHKGYALHYHKPYAKAVGGSGKGFILSRAGTYGDQAYTTTIWPGDLCNSFHRHRQDSHVGGLPAAIIGGLSLSTSGYPWFASDTGGYRHGRSPKDVFQRWTAYSALGTVMQTGGGNSHQVPWDFNEYDDGHGGKSVYDEETLDIYRKMARLHIRLHAYRDPYNRAAHQTGRPITSPVGFANPELGEHPDFVYLLGNDLLVAPVHDASGEVTVVLPGGTWYDWWTHEPITGPTTFTRLVPMNEIALYARAGAIIPLLRDTVDTLAPATNAEVDSYANNPGELTLRVFRGDGERVFETLGNTEIALTDGNIRITGGHFSAYNIELISTDGKAAPVSMTADQNVQLW